MADQKPATDATNALALPAIPETVDLDLIEREIAPSIDLALERAAKLAVNVVDDQSRELAIDAVEKLKSDCQKPLKTWREDYYRPAYEEAERRRGIFDSRLKKIDAVVKTIMGHVADYNLKKEREERLAKERAEAEARRLREEAERKAREAEEAERKRKQAEEDERRRKKEAEEAEARRLKAEQEAKERAEREAREAAAAETKRKLEEEANARIKHAETAEEVGNGPQKVDTILESPTPIAPVLGRPQESKSLEQQRLENEQATRAAEEKLLREEREAKEAAEKKRLAEEDAERKRKEAEEAAAAAAAAQAAAATTSIATKEESRTFGVETWKWDLNSDGTEEGDKAAVYALLEAIVATRGTPNEVPIDFIGYDPKKPQNFRPPRIGESVTALKDRFSCPGIKVYMQRDERFKPVARRNVGGRR